jgi:hypothetical protein
MFLLFIGQSSAVCRETINIVTILITPFFGGNNDRRFSLKTQEEAL